jgi:NADH-quinone oxidoreductase subunit C/D
VDWLIDNAPEGRHGSLQTTRDGIQTLWVPSYELIAFASKLKSDPDSSYSLLFDLTVIDERERRYRKGQPDCDFTLVVVLYSFPKNTFVRLKVALQGDRPKAPSLAGLWPAANWYEREAWDMFGVHFHGHPDLRRILMPPNWNGHPLRKDHPARATEMEPFDWLNQEPAGAPPGFLDGDDEECMFLNIGPQHPGTHGVLRVGLKLFGEEIVDAMVDIGYHHRGAEKMGERQTWHSYIPYTDRIDYLAGVNNNLAYLLSLEKLARIDVPPRAQVIRVMLCELFRIASHLVWYGTFAQDIGALSPVFYMFEDREKIMSIIEAICGGRLHPSWFRLGGVAHDLPKGWREMIEDLVRILPVRLLEYDKLVMKNAIFKARTKGIGAYTTQEAIEWGVTGPGLRATGLEWDCRRQLPYSGYEQFAFDIPVTENGDCYDRAVVRIEEMHQSLKIIVQCMANMPSGEIKSAHPEAQPPPQDAMLHDIETLIHHFTAVGWGHLIPAGEAQVFVEAPKGLCSYYLISDKSAMSYRTRIRTPSFAHMQMLPKLIQGMMIPDLLAILGAMDFVLADIDR